MGQQLPLSDVAGVFEVRRGLCLGQEKGIMRTPVAAWIEGIDAAHKLVILAIFYSPKGFL
jgi:homoserine dehydrogenase